MHLWGGPYHIEMDLHYERVNTDSCQTIKPYSADGYITVTARHFCHLNFIYNRIDLFALANASLHVSGLCDKQLSYILQTVI